MDNNQSQHADNSLDAGNFAILKDARDYFLYFSQLRLVIECLNKCFWQKPNAGALTDNGVSLVLEKLAYTMGALRMKYGFSRDKKLRIDMTDSGFPNALEFSQILTDLALRETRLAEPPTSQVLKQEMLDLMFESLEEPAELMEKMGERAYFKLLERDKLFLPFTSGLLKKKACHEHVRNYLFEWACFDFATNRPAVHLLHFEQDMDSEPLDDPDSNAYRRFEEVISAEGSRTPPLGILAIGIDNTLEDIHPKLLRRITFGPITTRQFSADPKDIAEILGKYSRNEQDFVLFGDEETVFSVDQKIQRGFFSSGKPREVFHLPVSDTECFERKVSKIDHFMVLPHPVLQHMDFSEEFKRYRRFKKIAYDEKGGVYAI